MIYHTIISGIDKLSDKNEALLSQLSSFEYKYISKSEIKNNLNNCDIFWFRLNHKLDREVLRKVRCKVIICAATGLDHIDEIACNDYNIKVISLRGDFEFLSNIRATAEHTMALTFSLLRKLKYSYSHVESGNWDRTLFKGNEIYKKNVGILGFGRLGKLTAEYFSAFGANVSFFDIREINETKYIRKTSIESLITNIDILSIHIPYNPKTKNLLNYNNLKKIKCNSIIINTSRGGIINENDLCKLIKNGIINGYAADVIYREPEINDSPIYKLSKNNQITWNKVF